MKVAPAFACAVVFALPSAGRAQVPDTYTYTIPGTVNASGLNGTRFVSDLAITNPGTAPAVAILTLVPANGTSQSLMLLNPGQTVVTRNVLQGLWAASGAAATVVNASGPLLIRARTYNTAASGTFGVALPVVADDRLLSSGDTADSLWISQSADGSAGYRTNVAVVFPDSSGGDATVTVYDANGNVAGTQAFSMASAGFQQFTVGSFAGAVAVGRAQISVTRGRATAYAVVVDNVTGDSSLFTFEDLPAGHQDVVANGVARANGRNSTFFRTDARIYNPTDADASVTVAFHANQNANANPVTATFNVPTGQIRDVVDVLATLLSLPVGSAGALRFKSAAPVAILCRTSNVDPTGVSPGTYGAQQKPVPLLSFLNSADAGAVVTGIRQNGSFRTNVGFAAGADGATWNLALKNAAGIQVASASGSLGAWGWTQPNVQDLFAGVTIPDDATLQVSVTGGSLDVFDSSIDNASGDPVVTPVMPLPAVIPTSATIGPGGGSVRSDDGRFTLKIPAGALSAPTPVSLTTTTMTAPDGTGPAYSISPTGFAPVKPVLFVFNYGRTDLMRSEPRWFAPALLAADGQWYPTASWRTDTSARTVTASVGATAPQARARGLALPPGFPNPTRLAYFVNVHGPTVVEPGTSAPLKLVVLSGYESDSGNPGALKVDPLAAYELNWYVDDHLGGFGAAGYVAPYVNAGPSTVFTAPPCPPESGYVTVDVRAFQDDREKFRSKNLVAVLPRRWTIKLEEEREVGCSVGVSTAVPTATYTLDASTVAAFSLDLDPEHWGGVIDEGRPSANLTISPPVACPAWNTCTLAYDASPPAQRITEVVGFVFRGEVSLYLNWVHVGEPGMVATCPSGTGIANPKAGSNDDSHFLVGWRGATHEVPVSLPGYNAFTRFTVKPTDAPCP